MPNWCFNDVTISASKKELKEIKELLNGESVFDFNKIFPTPKELEDIQEGSHIIDGERFEQWRVINGVEIPIRQIELEELREKYGFSSWYHWRLHNWGTKWNACDPIIIKENDKEIVYTFDTAWSPPEPIYKQLSILFPKATIQVYLDEESGMYRGDMFFENGQVRDETYTPD